MVSSKLFLRLPSERYPSQLFFTRYDEHFKGIEQINKALSEMERTTQCVSTNAEESSASVENLSNQTMELNSMVEEISRFIGSKRLYLNN